MIEKHYATHLSVTTHLDRLSRDPEFSAPGLLDHQVHQEAQRVIREGLEAAGLPVAPALSPQEGLSAQKATGRRRTRT